MKTRIQDRQRRTVVVTGEAAVWAIRPRLRSEAGRQDLHYSPADIAENRKARRKRQIQDKRDRRASRRVREDYARAAKG